MRASLYSVQLKVLAERATCKSQLENSQTFDNKKKCEARVVASVTQSRDLAFTRSGARTDRPARRNFLFWRHAPHAAISLKRYARRPKPRAEALKI